jgi:DNA topoisomerase II
MAAMNTDDANLLQSKYKKLDHREHVLTRPGMYIGSIDEDTYNTWVYDVESKRMVKKDIKIVPGLYKIFDEILVNAIDHVTRMKQLKEQGNDVQLVKHIKININRESGRISVWNDGSGIEIETHPDNGIYIPELIFGYMLTSTNYNDEDEKIIGGQNGIGAKACNIFSKSFKIETVDAVRKRIYTQEFTDNMTQRSKPIIKYCTKKPYTEIDFLPDYERFKMPEGRLTDDMFGLFMKRAYDVCALTDNDVAVWVNNEKLEFKNFESYVDLYLGPKTEIPRVYEKINDRWEVVAACNDNMSFEQVSFVNGICTIRGGKHVDYVSGQITSGLTTLANKKRKDVELKPQHVKNYLMVFVKSTITNPTFDSQTKDLLTTPVSKFGSKAELSDKFMDKLYKTDIVTKAISLCDANANKSLKKTDGKKATKIRGLVKLDDANMSGTAKSKECTLILTEGDSAKSMALAGISKVGRDYFGVFPLRGKLLNVKDVTLKKLMENEEIQNIKKIIGLESGKNYTSLDDLRYGRIMIMSDQDHDGSHIRGLIMNLFHTLWPSLMKEHSFITSLLTPIIKVTNKSNHQRISFYNIADYKDWLIGQGNNAKGWEIKYYKGLGTSTDEEAVEYFTNMHKVKYNYTGGDCNECLDLAFNKSRADDRKRWLSQYDSEARIDYVKEEEEVTYQDFINSELIHFSVYDVKRSIPSVVDGFKPSQRKILFGCLKRNLVKEAKVAQLAAYVSEHAAYHHGEASLQAAIICMAQDYVGSNNLNLLLPKGQFGSRRMGGKDAGAPRYIYTQLHPITQKIFMNEDMPFLTYLDDDGVIVEPEYYVPVLPVVLLNGCVGIGTGFSTQVPAFHPCHVIDALYTLIKTKGDTTTLPMLTPWYRGFAGSIEKADERGSAYFTKGCWRVTPNGKSIEVTELPIGTWTDDYKAFLEEYLEKYPKVLKDYESHYTPSTVRFILHFQTGELEKRLESKDAFEKEFRLVTKSLSTTNMHLFDANNTIKKYDTVTDILVDFYKVRLEYYIRRKASRINELEHQILRASAKARFIEEVCNNDIQVMRVSKDALEQCLEERGYPRIDNQYAFLVSMPIYNLTEEKRQALIHERDVLIEELAIYKSRDVKDMWMEELALIRSDYEKELQQYSTMNKPGAPAAKEVVTRKTPAKPRAKK